MTHLQLITTMETLQAVHNGLVDEGGCLLSPTHTIECDGELIGAVSIGAIPTVHYWFSEKHGHALKSIRAIAQIEDLMRETGIERYQTIIPDHSPFSKIHKRLGLVQLFGDTATLYIKDLGGK